MSGQTQTEEFVLALAVIETLWSMKLRYGIGQTTNRYASLGPRHNSYDPKHSQSTGKTRGMATVVFTLSSNRTLGVEAM